MKLLKYLVAIGLVYYFQLYKLEVVEQMFSNKELLKKIILGACGYMVLDFLLIRRWQNVTYFRTHTHEFTHSVAAMLTSKKVHQLAANEKDGHVLFSGDESWFVTLTPYFFPVYTILLLPIRFVINTKYLFWFDVSLIFIYAFHLHTFGTDFSFKQPDIKKNGYFLSTIYVIVGNLFCVLLVAALIVKGV